MTQVMIDIETLGTGHDAVILSIGAAKFDFQREGLIDSFYQAVDPGSCQHYGLSVTMSTVMWWLDEDRAEARKALLAESRLDLATVLEGFSMWFGPESLPVWGNGATFDNVIVRTAFERVHLDCPWKFWHDRCYRTVKALAPEIEIIREGTHHDALADAVSQAKHLQRIVRQLGVVV